MGLPRNLLLVRHGESEGNRANGRSHRGDDTAFSEEFRNRHGSRWRLTDKGRLQAKAAGEFISRHFPNGFDGYLTSEYIRAMETAGLLGLRSATWKTEIYLRERSWGGLEGIPIAERHERFSEVLKRKEIDPFYWRPPDGETIAELCLRIDRVFDTLHREFDGKDVILVCHGEVIRAIQMRIERLSQDWFNEIEHSRDSEDRINNGQVIHYTRLLSSTGALSDQCLPFMHQVRSVCPWDEKRSSGAWRSIQRKTYSNADLLGRVDKFVQLVT